ncbi:hypothetical protein GCM10023347_14360 [Streptomyces chumphonensis]
MSFFGTFGAPGPSATWVPGRPRRSPPTVDMFSGGFGGFASSAAAGAVVAPLSRAGSNTAAATVVRAAVRREV